MPNFPQSLELFEIAVLQNTGKKVKSEELQKALNSWVWEMYEKRIAVTDGLIQEKAGSLLAAIDQNLPNSNKFL